MNEKEVKKRMHSVIVEALNEYRRDLASLIRKGYIKGNITSIHDVLRLLEA